MKKTLLTFACATLASAAIAADTEVSTSRSTTVSGGGDLSSSTTTKTTTSSGTLHEYTLGSTFIVKESSGPMKYRYGKKVTYVTKSGKTLDDEMVRTRIKVGSPVSVHYGMEGEERVINRVEIDD